LHNPRQLDAHSYSEKYQVTADSVNETANPAKTENTPKFERGKAVITSNNMDIYISGTAAIIGEDSIVGDIIEQTKTTLDNIARLSSKENLYEHGIEILNDLPQFSSVRAYIKNVNDIEKVEEMCRKFFGDIPILFVIADVCRKELLVEIEAFMSCGIIV
jgi:enamine deaminase RidA (YjgF/YER057c/UK114 family)